MATLYVRNFPQELYERLKTVAAERRRSVSAEVVVLLEQALQTEDSVNRRLQALEEIGERRRRTPQATDAADTLTMLREDRAR